MAKVNKFEPCFFCGNMPCTCNSKAPKAKPAFKKQKKTEPKPEPQPTQVFHKPEVKRDLSYEQALRNLLPILHPKDQEAVLKEIEPPRSSSLGKRIARWRKDNGIQ